MYSNMAEIKRNGNQLSGNWHIFVGKARQRWGVVTSDNKDLSDGYDEEMAGEVQKLYGISKEKADLEIQNWIR